MTMDESERTDNEPTDAAGHEPASEPANNAAPTPAAGPNETGTPPPQQFGDQDGARRRRRGRRGRGGGGAGFGGPRPPYAGPRPQFGGPRPQFGAPAGPHSAAPSHEPVGEPIAGPHAILEAIRAGRNIRRLYVSQDRNVRTGPVNELIAEAQQRRIFVRFTDKMEIARLSPVENH